MIYDRILPVKRSKEIISVSTDIAGPFGKPEDVIEVYSGCKEFVDFGLEVICWRRINRNYFNKIDNLGVKVNGLHGPINAAGESLRGSWFDRLKGEAVDLLMIPNHRIQEVSNACPTAYVLIHERIINTPKKMQDIVAITKGLNEETILLVENLNDNGSMAKTIETVEQLNDRGAKAGILIDLVHLLKDISNSCQPLTPEIINKYWGKALAEIQQAASKVETVGFHLPVGVNSFDSLPVEKMEKQLWEDFAQLTAECPQVRFKTIENQRENSRTPFPISAKEMEVLKPRNYKIMTMLHQTGVI